MMFPSRGRAKLQLGLVSKRSSRLPNRTLSDLRYRLRAEELRAIAGQMTVEENRSFLVGVAEDYERLAASAEQINETRSRLAQLNERWPQPAIVQSPVQQNVAPARESVCTIRDKARAYRDMAGDAERLAESADAVSRQGWLSLAEVWTNLAEALDSQARDERPVVRMPVRASQ